MTMGVEVVEAVRPAASGATRVVHDHQLQQANSEQQDHRARVMPIIVLYVLRLPFCFFLIALSSHTRARIVPPRGMYINDAQGRRVYAIGGPYNEDSELRLTCVVENGKNSHQTHRRDASYTLVELLTLHLSQTVNSVARDATLSLHRFTIFSCPALGLFAFAAFRSQVKSVTR